MSGFDVVAVLRALRGFTLLESTTGRVHFIARPSTLTDVVTEGVEQFSWADRALCGITPRPGWVSITHLGDKNQSCRSCLARWHRLLWLFDRLHPSKQPPTTWTVRPPTPKKET